MGFFSKIGKGIKSAFKKIGKGIKSAFKKFGKFMNKIGILGQIAMFFIMPYVGQALGSMWTGIAGQTAAQTTAAATANTAAVTAGQAAGATAAEVTAGKVASKAITTAAKAGVVAGEATGLMASNAVAQGVGHVMQFTANTVGKVGTVFNNITQGVTDTLGNFAKTASNKMFGTSFDAAANFFTSGDSAFSRSFGSQSRFQNLTGSENLFETFKENRIAETELKLNTKAGQNAMDRTVAEGYGNDGMGFDSDYANNIQKSIDTGQSNFTASLDQNYVPDSAALVPNTITDAAAQRTAAEAGLGELYDVLETAQYGPKPIVKAPSLLERMGTGIKNIPERAFAKIGEVADDPLGFAFKGTEKALQGQMNLRIGQELGISLKPEYVQNSVTNNAYVPSFESFGGSQQQYGAPEIMNARSFEQQVTNNPSPYGYTAFQYGNYMAQSAQTA